MEVGMSSTDQPLLTENNRPPIDITPSRSNSNTIFGENLEPVLIKACNDRLTNIRWFRTDWQRGGALTGYGTFQTDSGPKEVVIKLPVPPQERRWLMYTQADQHQLGEITPKLFAHGEELGGYDMVWLVMERLKFGPMDSQWNGNEFTMLVDTIGRFYAVAANYPVNVNREPQDWKFLIDRARQKIRDKAPLDIAQQWNKTLKAFQKKLKRILKYWATRNLKEWRHGDVHLGNAMTRQPAPHGPALIFDFAMVRPGHWVEDATYFEHLYWADPSKLEQYPIVKMFAQVRKDHKLTVETNYPKLANIRRALLAATSPISAVGAGNPRFQNACLQKLEELLPKLKF